MEPALSHLFSEGFLGIFYVPGWAEDAMANGTEKSRILGELRSYTINKDVQQVVMSAVKKDS